MTKYTTSFGTEMDLVTNDTFYEVPSLILDIEAKSFDVTTFKLQSFPKFKTAKHIKVEILGITTNDTNWNNPVSLIPLEHIKDLIVTASVANPSGNCNELSVYSTRSSSSVPDLIVVRIHLTQPLQEIVE